MTDPSRTTDPVPESPLPPPIEVRSAPLSPPIAGSADASADVPSQAVEQAQLVYATHTPRAGELSPSWRIITLVTWIAVVLAFAAVWNSSAQLGLSTWWLGPRGQPRFRVVQLSPFIAPVLMVFGTINHIRWLGWWGLGASAVLAGYGIVDLGRVSSIAAIELLIAGLAAAVSIASLTGTYRTDPAAALR